MTPEPLYRLAGIRVAFGNRLALEIDDLSFWEGRLCALEGPNGSGKSTLLRLLAFLVAPTSGSIRHAGAEVRWTRRGLLPLRRKATLLHQSPCLFRGSVAENVAFGLKARGVPEAERRRRVADALESVGLPGFGARDAKALSGGEERRVALARALAVAPSVLLLDEPFSGVDRESAALLGDIVAALPQKGTTVILSSHDAAMPAKLATEVIRLEAGRLSAPPGGGAEVIELRGGDRRHAVV